MGIDYKRLEFELYEQLLMAKELLEPLHGSDPITARLDEELERIKTKNIMLQSLANSAEENPV